MKKRVLIIAQHFAPENIISAVRPTKVAKYLTRAGYEVTVLTSSEVGMEDAVLAQDLPECGRVLRAERVQVASWFSRLLHRPIRRPNRASAARSNGSSEASAPAYPAEQSAFRRKLSGVKQYFRVRRREQEFYRAALGYVQNAGLDLSHFDVMISTYSPMSTHMVALALKAKCPTLKWIADYRDPMDPTRPPLLRRYYEKWQKRILPSCDAVSAASEGYLKMLCEQQQPLRSRVIYNGFDPEDLHREVVGEVESDPKVFTILGMGGLYAGRRDVSIVLQAVSDLLKSGRIKRDQIRIDYYGARSSTAYLRAKVEELELEPVYVDHGRVTRGEVLAAQKGAQILLSSGWDTEDYHGVIPGKFSEQLLLQKPIIGVVCGTGVDSELSRLIRSLRVGFCYEEAGGAEAYEELKKYIAESCTYYRTRKRELYEPDEKKCAAFGYNQLIRRWIELIEEC